jgi:hypothetical protein
MPRLRSDTELMLALLYWRGDPRGKAERLKLAAESYLTDPAIGEGLRKARPYTERLAHACLACAGATPEQIPLAQRSLAEVAELAAKEQKDERDATMRRELDEARAKAIAAGDLPQGPVPPRTRWDERKDLQ